MSISVICIILMPARVLLSAVNSDIHFSISALLIVGFLSVGAASIYAASMLKRPSSHTEADIRFGILTMLGAYIIASIMRLGAVPPAALFFPGVQNISSVFIALYAVSFTMNTRASFHTREVFLELTAIYSGDKLQAAIRTEQEFFFEGTKKLSRTMNAYSIQAILTGVLVMISLQLGGTFRPVLIAALFIFYVSVYCIQNLTKFYRDEIALSSIGLVIKKSERLKQLSVMGIISLFCTAAAFILSSKKSILPFSIISNFFSRLFSFFKIKTFTHASLPEKLPAMTNSFDNMMPPLIPPYAENKVWPYWHIVRYVIIALLITGVIIFLLKPLIENCFDRNKNKRVPLLLRVFNFLARWFLSLRKGFSKYLSLILTLSNGERLSKNDGAELQNSLEAILEKTYSKSKRSEIKKSAALFMRLINWGGIKYNILWRESLGPLEYCKLLAACEYFSSPPESETREKILRIGTLFEKAIYSKTELTTLETEEYKTSVMEIISL